MERKGGREKIAVRTVNLLSTLNMISRAQPSGLVGVRAIQHATIYGTAECGQTNYYGLECLSTADSYVWF